MGDGLDKHFKTDGLDDPPVAFDCVITDTVNSPTDKVGAEETSGNGHYHDDCIWAPRIEPDGEGGVQIRYPERGDRALVVLPDSGKPWIVEWTPYA